MLSFSELWRAHPINESVTTPCLAPFPLTNLEGKLIGRGLPVFANQCAIRMGIALRRAGVTPEPFAGCQHCVVHRREDMHFINANQLASALSRVPIAGIGPREILKEDEPRAFYPKLFGRTGIIYIQDYWQRTTDQPGHPTGDHIDVWNGYRSSAKWLMEWFSWLGYYSNYAQASEIWFWEVR